MRRNSTTRQPQLTQRSSVTQHAGVTGPVATTTGLEPATFGATIRYSSLLNYVAIFNKAQKKIYAESNRSFCFADKRSTNELQKFFKRNIAVCAFGTEDGT